MTARQAVAVLKAEGLVRSEHGRGVFVRRRPVVIRSARNRFTREFRETGKGAYDVEMKRLGRTPETELVELGPVFPPAEVAERLRLGPGEQALIRRRSMYADHDPMQLATSFVPWSLAEGTVASPAVPMVAAIAIGIFIVIGSRGLEEIPVRTFLYDLKRREPTSAASGHTARQP